MSCKNETHNARKAIRKHGSTQFSSGTPAELALYRGVALNGQPADPGDLGIGKYYSTSKSVAKSYGSVTATVLRLQNPLVLDGAAAIQLVEEAGTLKGDLESRKKAAVELTQNLMLQGYDGIVVSGWDSPAGHYTVIQFPTE